MEMTRCTIAAAPARVESAAQRPVSQVILIGPVCAGKSTLARLIAEQLNLPRICLDGIAERYGSDALHAAADSARAALRLVDGDARAAIAKMPELPRPSDD